VLEHDSFPNPSPEEAISPVEEALPAPAEQQPSRIWSVLREVIETVLLAAIIWLAVNFATARYVVDGQSMEPNLHTGQFLIVSRLAYRFGSPQRGDIVVFDYPGNPADDYVKRIIGLPGDIVLIENNQVFVNDTLLSEPYLPPDDYTTGTGRWVIPEGNYFVMGDNRAHSSDSRQWGLLSMDKIIGKAWVSYWPPESWGFLPHFDYNTAAAP
jgi:signal peptidase I